MKLTTNTRYAIRILCELAESSGLVSISTLSEKTGISLRTIEQIHTVCKQFGLTTGTVGAKGGIQLQRDLKNISLGEIILLFDDGIEFSVCCGDKSNNCPHQDSCASRNMWYDISMKIQEQLNIVSLQDIFVQYNARGGKI